VSGGIKSLTLVDPNDLAVQPAWNIAQTTDLQFKPGASAFMLEQEVKSGRIQSDHDTTNAAGDFFTYNLEARVRTIRATMESFRAKILNRRIHIIGTYQNDTRRLLPYTRLAISDDSGARRGDNQGYLIRGLSSILMPGPDVRGNITIVDPPTGGGGGTPPVTGAGVQIVTISATTSTATYLIEAGKWLVGWEVRSSSAQSPALGLTASGNELGGPVDLTPLQVWVGQGNAIPTYDATNIYFSGLVGNNTIKLWILA
jgi:hypothetical protein